MKALNIARKTLLELVRESLSLGLMLFFPVMLIVFYYIAFGRTDDGLASYLRVLVVNDDVGQAGAELTRMMQETEFDGEPVFDVEFVTDRRAAEIALREHKASLLLVVPPNFTPALSGGSIEDSPTIVSLVGNPESDNFVFAQGFLDDLVRQFARRAVGREDTVTVIYEFLPGTGTMSDFDFGVPGVIVFGIMFVTVTTAETMVRENVNGTLRRLRLTCARARDVLSGVTAAQMAVALVQVPVTFGTALLFGFHSQGSLLLAMGIGLLLTLSAVGLGLLVACFARNDGEASNLSAVVGVLMALVSGAMYPMPDAPIATVAGRTIQLYDILPPAHAAEAMRRVLVFGEGPAEVAYELAAMMILSVLFLIVGVFLYQRLRMRRV
jgi:ABC-2 type transport system permease protein